MNTSEARDLETPPSYTLHSRGAARRSAGAGVIRFSTYRPTLLVRPGAHQDTQSDCKSLPRRWIVPLPVVENLVDHVRREPELGHAGGRGCGGKSWNVQFGISSFFCLPSASRFAAINQQIKPAFCPREPRHWLSRR